MTRNKSVMLVCWSVVACGGAPASVPPLPAAAPKAFAPSPATGVAPPPAPTSAAPSAVSPFYVVGELPTEVTLYPAGDRAFLASQAGIELAITGDEVVQDPLLQRGLPDLTEMFTVDGVAGRWPDSLWLSTTHPSGRTGFSSLWQWDGKKWLKKQSTVESHIVVAMQPWVGGRMLAVEQASMMFDASFLVLSGDRKITVPQFSKAKTTDDFSFCTTQLRVEAFAALPSGHLFAAGQRCDPRTEALDPAVERWAPGQKQSVLDVLPATRESGDPGQAGWSVTALAAVSASEVYLAAEKDVWSEQQKQHQLTEYFARFDGSTWQSQPVPIPGGVHGLWAQLDGVLWALGPEQQLWSRSASGAWAPVPLPSQITESAKVQVRGFWSHAPGDTWAIVRSFVNDRSRPDYLLHTRPAANKLPTIEAFGQKQAEMRLPGPPVDWCATPFVLLYTLGRKAPADYDYPATRAALKGHREFADAEFVEFRREERRYFGARVPDFKLGKKLATLVKDKVPGSTPALVCHDPLDLRKLPIDLATGELKK
jgi:hypothetical protein